MNLVKNTTILLSLSLIGFFWGTLYSAGPLAANSEADLDVGGKIVGPPPKEARHQNLEKKETRDMVEYGMALPTISIPEFNSCSLTYEPDNSFEVSGSCGSNLKNKNVPSPPVVNVETSNGYGFTHKCDLVDNFDKNPGIRIDRHWYKPRQNAYVSGYESRGRYIQPGMEITVDSSTQGGKATAKIAMTVFYE